VNSAWPLPCPTDEAPWLAQVSLLNGSAARFRRTLGRTSVPPEAQHWVSAPLSDGSTYLRWSRLFEFLIAPDGKSIFCRPLSSRVERAFQTHLGASVSFALINLGIEPLHSTTVVVDGAAVALMGDCGYGKSSLGASFVSAGRQLLTDDLLVLNQTDAGFLAYPGIPRVKLFPDLAKLIFGPDVRGKQLEPLTPKLIIALNAAQACRRPAPLKAIYLLTPPESAPDSKRVAIRRLSRRRAFVELVRNTFNMAVTDPGRLERQFTLATLLALHVPVKSVSYPRKFYMLAQARDAILDDLRSAQSPRSGGSRRSSPHPGS
jgi:hypothetical protein